MQRILLLGLFIPFFSTAIFAADNVEVLPDEKPAINDTMDEINYSVGHQLGRDLRRQHVEVRSEVLWQGIVDGATDDEALMSMEDMLDILIGFRADIVETYEEQKKGYRLRGAEYLAENENKPGVVSLASGLQYRLLKKGNPEGKTPTDDDHVRVKYVSRDIDGQIFSSSLKDGVDAPLELAVNTVIPGWKEALKLMKEGDKLELYVPTRLGFKDTGPMAGQTTVYEVELVEVLPRVYQ